MTTVRKYILLGAVGFVILSVFLLSSGVVNPSWNPFQQPPSGEVLQNAIANLAKIEKMRVQALANLAIETGKQNPSQVEGSLQLDQIIDYSDKTNKKISADVNVAVGVSGMELSFGAKLISVDKSLFLNITTLPPYLPLGVDVETIENQWLFIDPALFRSGQAPLSSPALDSQFLGDLKGLLIGQRIFKIKQSKGQETIDNQATDHYLAEIDKQTFKEVFPEFIKLMERYLPQNSQEAYQDNLQQTIEQFQQNFETIWKQLGGFIFDAWITQNQNILKKVRFKKEIGGNSADIEILFSDFNKEVVIEAPADAKPIEQVLPADLLGISIATSTATTTQ
ncbi:MAG: hypothetical protein PHE77_01605 [Candidatus Pacebacteria bacterium]|nr:hypothetical protein [Candidatus Paceibacterota bacterium]